MSKNLIISKSKKCFKDFEKHFSKENMDEIDIISITPKDHENNPSSTLKKEFYKYLEKDVKLDYIEYPSEKIINPTVFWDIGEFIVKDIVLSTTIGLLFNFIDDLKIKND